MKIMWDKFIRVLKLQLYEFIYSVIFPAILFRKFSPSSHLASLPPSLPSYKVTHLLHLTF